LASPEPGDPTGIAGGPFLTTKTAASLLGVAVFGVGGFGTAASRFGSQRRYGEINARKPPMERSVMSQSDQAWEDVGEQFKKLGAMFREHYEAQRTETEEEVTEAVRGFSENMRSALGAVIETVTDSDVHEEARDTAGSFLEALGATFSQLGADLKRRSGGDPD
jgi:hypothetical protein